MHAMSCYSMRETVYKTILRVKYVDYCSADLDLRVSTLA